MRTNVLTVNPVKRAEESRFKRELDTHHYLGAVPKIGETLWYVARRGKEWVGLVCFSAPAWKCAVRDRWIGWDFRTQYDRLHLIANNSRFLLLPGQHQPNLGSRVLALCERRIAKDWERRFGHALLLLETFVDPRRFRGTLYRAANWIEVGKTRGYKRITGGYSSSDLNPKLVFLRPLDSQACKQLVRKTLLPAYTHGKSKNMLAAKDMHILPELFRYVEDPRKGQGRRHALVAVLSIVAAATMCGVYGSRDIAKWAQRLNQKTRRHLGCRYVNGTFVVPSEYVIRNLLARVNPEQLDKALASFHSIARKPPTIVATCHGASRNAIASAEKPQPEHPINQASEEQREGAGLSDGNGENNTKPSPFVKWAGGKRTLCETIISTFPHFGGTYWEPFVGGGAVFFALGNRIARAYLSDKNINLILTYKALRDHVEDVIEKLQWHASHHSRAHYFQVRDQYGKEKDPIAIAAQLIYLNKTCFNGLYRENRQGKFNVPPGSYTNPKICDIKNLLTVSQSLQKATIKMGEFEHISPIAGDIVYCDPPYHGTFTAYTGGGFNEDDQRHLRDACIRWKRKGIHVIISNSATPFIRQLYKGFTLHMVSAPRHINRDGNNRGHQTEALIVG